MSTRRQKFTVWTIGLFMATVAFAGGFWGGASTPSGSIIIPSGGSGVPARSIRFDSSTAEPNYVANSNGSWYIYNDEAQTTGKASTDNVLSFDYNALRTSDGSVVRPLTGEHAVGFRLESSYCVGACDPNTMKGTFEWNIGFDDRLGTSTVDAADPNHRRWFFTYDMDGKRADLTIGAAIDANSASFYAGQGQYGDASFLFTSVSAAQSGKGAWFRPTTGAAPAAGDLKGIYLGPGVPHEDNFAYAVLDTYYVAAAGDFNLEAGRDGDNGAIGDISLARRRKGDVRIGEADDGGAGADGSKLHVSNEGIEFDEDNTPPTCAANNYNVYASNVAPAGLKVCQSGVITDFGSICKNFRVSTSDPIDTSGDTFWTSAADGTALTSDTTTETNVDNSVVPMAAYYGNMYVTIDVAPGAGTSRAITLRDDVSSTAVTCTISNTATSCTYTSTPVLVAAQSKLDWQIVNTGAVAAAAEIIISVCVSPQ